LKTKLYTNKVWLQSRYAEKTAAQIAEECGVSEATISRYLTQFKIRIRRSR
jgi:DNA-directed RNA polymerase specialized sigma subunit